MLSKVIPFPHSQNVERPAMAARRAIEKRFGVSFSEFMSVNRSEETQRKIDRALQRETLIIASNRQAVSYQGD